MMNSLKIRKLLPSDGLAVTQLYFDTFGIKVDPSYWEWKYINNPSGQIYTELAFDDDRCVGQYAMLPMSICVDGVETDTLVALDNMVHPDYQRRGILKQLEKALAEDRPNNIPYFTFLNENSFPMYIKHFGWTYMGPLDVFMKPLGVRSLAMRNRAWGILNPFFAAYRRFHANRDNRLTAEPFTVFGEEIEALWNRTKASLGVTLNRSQRFLQWRFSEAPIAYEKYEIRDHGDLRGYAIVRMQEKFGLRIGWLLDLLVDNMDDVNTYANALLAVEERLLDRCDFLSLISPSINYEKEVKHAGFKKVPKGFLPHQFYFCVRRNDYANVAVLDREHWYFTWSLHDVL